jgi:hypothetical protein
LKKEKLKLLSIFRPGMLLHRDNDSRCGEKIASIIPFIDKIESRDTGKVLMKEAEIQI